MSKDHEHEHPDLLEELRKLSLKAATDFLEFKQRMNEIGDQLDGTPFAGAGGSGISDRPRPEAGAILYQTARLQLEMASRLLTLGHEQAELWLDRARRFGEAVTPIERRPPVRLVTEQDSDEPGVRWSPVHVYNARRQSVTIAVRFRTWRMPNGPLVSEDLHLSVEPATIGARSSQEVAVVLDQIPAGLAAGDHLVEAELDLAGTAIGRLALTLRLGKPT